MTTRQPIYADNNATTPLDPQVLKEMEPYLKEHFGNPASTTHSYGWRAEMAVARARRQVAKTIGAQEKEITFTSGATESNNLAILGALGALNGSRRHFITTNIEHKAVLEVMEEVARRGHAVTILPVDHQGQIRAEQVAEALRPDTALVSIMHANNEIGTVQPIAEIGRLLRNSSTLFHTDAAQSIGKLPIDVEAMGIDLLSLSGHKVYGPKGVGALYVRGKGKDVALRPILFGGTQEGGLRPGTLNVPGIVGLGCACEIASTTMSQEAEQLREWRDRIWLSVQDAFPGAKLNGHPSDRLCNNLSLSFPDLKQDLFAFGLHGLAVSSGSACTSSSGKISHVLKAIGLEEERARATLRIGLGRFNTANDIDGIIQILRELQTKNTALIRAQGAAYGPRR